MIPDTRRAPAAFKLSDVAGEVVSEGGGEATLGEGALGIGTVSVPFIDVDVLHAADYRIALEIWPDRRLTLTELGRRFDTFVDELRRARNQARVAGLLAHGTTMPELFAGAVLTGTSGEAAEFQLYDTHVTIVPADRNPLQLPLGAITALSSQDDPPAVVIETGAERTVLGQLGRQRDAVLSAIATRRGAQQRFLADLTGEEGFSDGWGVDRSRVRGFDRLLARSTSVDRTASCHRLLESATGEPRVGFVQLLDPEGERLPSAERLRDPWAAFLLVPVGTLTVLEILAGPSAATYVFRGDVDSVNRDLQLLHFRRAQLALAAEQAVVTPSNPHRLALRALEPLQRLRTATVARIVHSDRWESRLLEALR